MKELKALEILNQYVKDKEWILNNIKESSPHKEREIKIITDDLNVGREAIAELEALDNRNCENCKNAYYQQLTSDLDDDVYSCDEFETNFINVNDSARPKDFYYNK